MLVADHRGNGEGGYYYLEPSPTKAAPAKFPRKLSETGCSPIVKQHAMQPGVIPYSVNSPLWSDGAHKERFFAVPEQAASDFKIDLAKKNGWDFPEATVLVKSFALETTSGDPAIAALDRDATIDQTGR